MIQAYERLFGLLNLIAAYCKGRGNFEEIPADRRAIIRKLLVMLKPECDVFEAESAVKRIERIDDLLSWPSSVAFDEVNRQFKTLRENLEDDLKSREFFFIPQAKLKFLRETKDIPIDHPKDVIQARHDWHEAIWSYVLERYDAAVFHCMRVAEVGLRTLTRKLVGNQVGNRDVEMADWHPMLQAIEPIVEAKLKALENTARTPEREAAVRFYSGAMSHLQYFKTFRDEGAHARGSYGERAGL